MSKTKVVRLKHGEICYIKGLLQRFGRRSDKDKRIISELERAERTSVDNPHNRGIKTMTIGPIQYKDSK